MEGLGDGRATVEMKNCLEEKLDCGLLGELPCDTELSSLSAFLAQDSTRSSGMPLRLSDFSGVA